MDEKIKDLVFGAVFGEAIGDALGHPIEFKKTHKVEDLPSITDPAENKFTDDTQMFCAIGEALLDAPPHIDEDTFMACVADRFDRWRREPLGGSHRAPGGNCMDAVRKLGAGVHWTKAGGLDFKGNGSAMRSGIVGAYYWRNPEYAFRIGALTSVCTHNNLESLLGAGMVAFLVAHSIQNGNWAEAIGHGLRLCGDFPKTLPFYPQQVKFGVKYDEQNPWYAVSHFGAAFALGCSVNMPISIAIGHLMDRENIVTDGAVVPAVAEAIYFNTPGPNYSGIVLNAVNNSDDTDTIGAIAGTIAGARYGCLQFNGGIPHVWQERIEMSEYLADLSERIFEKSITYEQEQKEAEVFLDGLDYDDMLRATETDDPYEPRVIDEGDLEIEL